LQNLPLLAAGLVLLSSANGVAQQEKQPSAAQLAAAAKRVPRGFKVVQGAVFPTSCGGVAIGLDLDSHPVTELTADSTTHLLSTNLGVSLNQKVLVPNYARETLNDPASKWTCTTQNLDLRNYVDPTTGKVGFPGPTLRITRASEIYPQGDRIQILLQNNLEPDSDDCIWRDQGCPDCGSKTPPECCLLKTQPKGMNCFHGENNTNLHFHGLHISPQKPQDWVLLELHPAQPSAPAASCDNGNICYGRFQYSVDPVRDHQAEGTHWYHPHKHGATAVQVGNGMAGALIVHGPFDDWLNVQFQNKLRERILVIQQIHALNFIAESTISGEIPLVNGLLMPTVTMYPGEIQRWRVVSATMEASAQIAIDFNSVANTPVLVKQIAMDGVRFSARNYQCQPLLSPETDWNCDGGFPRNPRFYLSPGNRADFLVKAPDKIGTYMVSYDAFGAVGRQGLDTRPGRRGKRNLASARQLTRDALNAITAGGVLQPALLQIKVVPCPEGRSCTMTFPKILPPMPDFLKTIVPTDSGHKLQFQIVPPAGPPAVPPPPGPNSTFGIWVQGQDRLMQFQERCAALTMPLDSNGGQQWEISQNINTGPDEGVPGAPLHVFHMHTNPFQVVSTKVFGKEVTYPEPIWQDSVTVPNNHKPLDPRNPSAKVVILQRFEDFTGQSVLHCHFLGHEDRGMMLSTQTVCPRQPNSYSVTSPTIPECVTDQFLKALPPCPPTPSGTHTGHNQD